MAEVFEELVRARKGCAEARFSARVEKLGVDVSFVLRNHDVLGMTIKRSPNPPRPTTTPLLQPFKGDKAQLILF